MSTIYRISRSGREPVGDVDAVEAIEGAIRAGDSCRFHVDEIASETPPSGHTSRRCGVGIKRPDGSVPLDPDPWPDR
jgi:hypothetical protein